MQEECKQMVAELQKKLEEKVASELQSKLEEEHTTWIYKFTMESK